MTSPLFAAAVEKDSSLAGPALLNVWNQELAQIYASGLCLRLQPVLAGLLNLPPTAAAAARAPVGVEPARAPTPQPARSAPSHSERRPAPAATSQPHESRPPQIMATVASAAPHERPPGRFATARTLLVTLLAFLGGVLLPLALALGLGIGIGRRPNPSPPAALLDRSDPVPSASPAASPAPWGAAPTPRTLAPTPAPSGPDPATAPGTSPTAEDAMAAQQRAISSVQQLYDALASRDYERARGFFSSQAADQFDPSYVEQYEQVSIQDLRVTGQSGSVIQLEGVVSLVQPDGSRHLESRSFSVDAAAEPARVTASAFLQVLR